MRRCHACNNGAHSHCVRMQTKLPECFQRVRDPELVLLASTQLPREAKYVHLVLSDHYAGFSGACMELSWIHHDLLGI